MTQVGVKMALFVGGIVLGIVLMAVIDGIDEAPFNSVTHDPWMEQRIVESERDAAQARNYLKLEILHLQELIHVYYEHSQGEVKAELTEILKKWNSKLFTWGSSPIAISTLSNGCVEACSNDSCEWETIVSLIKHGLVKVLPSGRICVKEK